MKRQLTIAGLILATTISATQAMADDSTAVDKSNYDLFNPTPTDQMRDFSSDRPGQGMSPYTVDAGHFQYESDLVNWSHTGNNNSFTTADPTVKYGITNYMDLEASISPVNINNSNFGFGDIYVKSKINLFGNDGGKYALAVVPYVKIPTASSGFGDGNWSGGVATPFEASLPMGFALSYTAQMDILKNSDNNGMHPDFQNSLGFSHNIFNNDLSAYMGVWSDVSTDRNIPTQYEAEPSLAWMIDKNVQLDVGVNVGLNKASTGIQPYIGISERF